MVQGRSKFSLVSPGSLCFTGNGSSIALDFKLFENSKTSLAPFGTVRLLPQTAHLSGGNLGYSKLQSRKLGAFRKSGLSDIPVFIKSNGSD